MTLNFNSLLTASFGEMASREMYEQAVAAMNDGLSLRTAAEAFRLSQTSLWRAHGGDQAVGTKRGAKTVLSHAEEQSVVDACIHLARVGRGLTTADLKWKVMQITADNRQVPWDERGPGDKWVRGFFKRWPEALSLRKASVHDGLRRAADNEEQLREYFGRVRVCFDEHNFPPDHIHNCDETGDPLLDFEVIV